MTTTRTAMARARGPERKNKKAPRPKRKPDSERPFDTRSHAGRRGGVVLEETATKPSRKSTRKSSNRTKATTNLQLREQMRTHSPTKRNARGKVGGPL